MKNIKHLIAVASAKGGVGKSTIAYQLALALLAQGHRVGLLDADIYGPSQPHLLGIHQQPEVIDAQLKPVIAQGLQTMSIGYLLANNQTPVVWRAPMATRMLQQLLRDTAWDNVDYLIIDMPPGTGDIQLTIAQKVALTGAIIVTTPQELAVLDARKGIEMFNKVKIPVLGIIENMSFYTCQHCGEPASLFGQGGGESLAQQYQVPLLGQIPLAPTLDLSAIAHQVHEQVSKLSKRTSKFPPIVIQEQ